MIFSLDKIPYDAQFFNFFGERDNLVERDVRTYTSIKMMIFFSIKFTKLTDGIILRSFGGLDGDLLPAVLEKVINGTIHIASRRV